jgi:uncharacterized repeat protein (TIGR02543 family)
LAVDFGTNGNQVSLSGYVTSDITGYSVVYATTTTGCTIVSGVLSFDRATTCTITYTVSATNYADKTGSFDIVISRGGRTLSWVKTSDSVTRTYRNSVLAVNTYNLSGLATTTGDGTVEYATVSGPCTIAGNTLTFTGIGVCTFSSSIPQTSNYNLANASGVFTLTINREIVGSIKVNGSGSQNITYGNTASVTFTSDPVVAGADALYVVVSGTAENCSIDPSAGEMLLSTTSAGTCVIRVDFVNPAENTEIWAATANITITFTQRTLTVTPSVASSTQGAGYVVPSISPTYSGWAPGDSVDTADVRALPTCILTKGGTTYAPGAALDPGVYTITCSGMEIGAGDTAPYSFNYVATTITVVNSQTISASVVGTAPWSGSIAITAILGNTSNQTVLYSVTGGTATNCVVSDSGVVRASSAGTCVIKVEVAADANGSGFSAANTSVTAEFSRAARSVSILAADNTITLPATGIVVGTASVGTGAITYYIDDVNSTPLIGCSVNVNTGVVSATGEGTCAVYATVAQDVNYLTANSDNVLIVFSKQSQLLVLAAESATGVWGTPVTTSTSGSSGNGTITYEIVGGTTGCHVSATGVVTADLAVTCVVKATIPADGTYSQAVSNEVSIAFANQNNSVTIAAGVTPAQTDFHGTITVTGTPVHDAGTVSYGLDDGTYGNTSSATCDVTASGVVSSSAAGFCYVYAIVAGDGSYNSARSADILITFISSAQTITATKSIDSPNWSQSVTIGYADAAGTGTRTYFLDNGLRGHTSDAKCSLVGTTLTATGAATCWVYVKIAADSNYAAATSVDLQVVFGKVTPTVSVGIADLSVLANGSYNVVATSNVAGTFVISVDGTELCSGSTTEVDATTFTKTCTGWVPTASGDYVISVAFAPSNTTDYTSTATDSYTQTVEKNTSTIAITGGTGITYLGSGNVTYTANTPGAVVLKVCIAGTSTCTNKSPVTLVLNEANQDYEYTYSWTPSAAGSWDLFAIFTPADAGAWSTPADTAATTTVSVAKAAQTVTTDISSATITHTVTGAYYDMDVYVTTTAHQGNVSYQIVSGPCTFSNSTNIKSTGAGDCSIKVIGAATANYLEGYVLFTLHVLQGVQTLTLGKNTDSQKLLATSASNTYSLAGLGTSNGDGAVTYAVASGAGCQIAGDGTTLSFNQVVDCVITATTAATTNFAAQSKTFTLSVTIGDGTVAITSNGAHQTYSTTSASNTYALSNLGASKTGDGTIGYSIVDADPTGCYIDAGYVHFTNVGDCLVEVRVSGTTNFLTAFVNFTLTIDKLQLATPGSITATKVSATTARVNFTAVSYATSMSVWVVDRSTNTSREVPNVTNGDVIDGLVALHTYVFYLVAVGTGNFSDSAVGPNSKALAAGANAPKLITVGSLTQQAVTIGFVSDASATATTAQLYLADGTAVGGPVDCGSTSACTFTGLTPATQYYIGLISSTPTGETVEVFSPLFTTVAGYTVTYNYGSGTGSVPTDATSYVNGATVTVGFGTLPTKANYHFVGWATSANATVADYAAAGATSFNIGGNTVLYAVFAPNENTVTFHGPSSNTTQTVLTDASTALTTNAFTRAGFTFQGWDTNAAGTTVVYRDGASITLTGNVDLYAVWAVTQIVVSFNSNGGAGTQAPQTVDYGVSTALNANSFTRTGFTFAGWSLTAGGSVAYTDGSQQSFTTATTLYAIWTANTVVVTFHGPSSTITQDFTAGSAQALSNNSFTRTGYTFVGWATSNGGTVQYANGASFTTAVATDLYAVWSLNTVTVTFNGNGGSGSIANQVFDYGVAQNLTANSFTKVGYTFQGWSLTANGSSYATNSQSVTLTGNTTLYAIWTANTNSVVFHAGLGSGSMSNQSVDSGATVNLTSNAFTKTGYTFAGWALTENGAVQFADGAAFSTTDATTNLWAIWTVTKVAVSYAANGGTGSVAAQSFDYGIAANLALNGFARTGYTFQGWATAADGAVVYTAGQSVSFTTATTLYAVWAADTVTITFHGPASTTTQNFTSGVAQALTANSFTRTGYTFVGWATSNGGAVVYANGASFTTVAAADLWAIWSLNQVTVSFNANNGSGTVSNQVIAYGVETALTGNAFARTGYTFAGWSTTIDGSVVYADLALVTLTADTNLYAIWTANTNTIVFHAGTGAGSMSNQSVDSGATVNLTANAFTKTGFTFLGWALTENGAVQFANNASFSTTDATTNLWAIWTVDGHVVSFNSKNGSAVTAGSFVTGGTLAAPSAPTRTGYTFAGWSATDGGVAVSFPYAPGVITDITLYAIWTANTNSVVFHAGLGSGSMSNQSVDSGATVNLTSNAFTKTGYTFAGWALTENGAVQFADGAAFSTTDATTNLWAIWTVTKVAVSYAANGGTGSVAAQSFDYGIAANLALNGFARTGYTFQGWATAADGAVVYTAGQSVSFTTATTLYAVWAADTVTVTFRDGVASSTQQITAGTATALTANTFTKAGYTFAGWATVLNGSVVYGNQAAVTFLANGELFAVWTLNQVTVSFNSNGGVGTQVPQLVDYNVATALNANLFTRTGYTFAGWATTSGGSVAYADLSQQTFTSATTLYAVWTATQVTVTFIDGVSQSTQQITAGSATALTANTFTKAGYTFAGWSATNGGSVLYGNSALVTLVVNTSLYAVWTLNQVTVSFNSNGGSGTQAPQLVDYGVATALNANLFTRTGYTFAGWATTSGGSVAYADLSQQSFTSATTLYAVWTATQVTVTFIDGVSQSTQQITAGSATALTANTFTKTNFTFAGWATTNGGPVVYGNGSSVTLFANTSLYAVWTANSTFTVTYNGNTQTTGTAPTDATQYQGAATVTVLGNTGTLAKAGYIFAGWCTVQVAAGTACATGASYQPSSTFAINASVTLFAVWATTYTVTYNANTGTGTLPVDANRYVAGATVTTLTNSGGLALTNYQFNGWCTSNASLTSCATGAQYGTGVNFTMGAANVTLYAIWLPIPGATVAQATRTTLAGASVTLTATVTAVGAAGVPTGTATFMSGNVNLGSCVLTAGTCFINTTLIPVGAASSIVIVYGGSARYGTATSAAVTHQVVSTPLATTTTSAATLTATYGTTQTLTATVTAGAYGTVTILVRGVAAGTCAVTELVNTCSITAPATAFIGGANAITASFAGATGSGYAASTSAAVTVTVAKATIAATVTTSLAATTFGTSVNLTATVGTTAGVAPTGVVTFTTVVGAVTTTLGTCTLANLTCVLTTTLLPVGATVITASYAGDGNYNAATATVATTVGKGTPTVAVTTPLVSVQTGTGFTLTTTVTAGAGTATGVITLSALNASNVATALGTCTLAAGTCSLAILGTKLPVGVYRITASYAGDTNFLTATSAQLGFTVTKLIRAVTLTTSAASVAYKTSITFTATVAKVTGTTNPSGVVTFTTVVNNATVTLGTCTLSTTSTCTLAYATLPVGTYVVTASYAGDANYMPGTITVAQAVVKATPTITAGSVLAGARGAMKSTLTITLGTAGVTGIVTILDGTTVLGTCTLANNATATASVCTFVTPVLAAGVHSITAVYAGDVNFLTVTSVALSIRTF